MSRHLAILLMAWFGLIVTAGAARASDVVQTAAVVGGPSDDEAFTGAAILSDGTIVLAGNVGALRGDGYKGAKERAFGRLQGEVSAAVLHLSGDGKQVLSIARLPGSIHDLAIDGSDAIYLAAGDAGLVKLNPAGTKVLWDLAGKGPCTRVDAAMGVRDSDVAAFFGGDESTGTIVVASASGRTLSQFAGHQKTKDVAIDPAAKRVFLTGFKNDRGNGTPGSKWEKGAPVQVAYLLARDYAGKQVWKAYDWPGREVGYVAGGLSSMADTRGLRVSLGQDGKLYAAFMSAGGDHIFRYDSIEFGSKSKIVGGDKHHEFYNSASEHKGLYGRFDPATGQVLAMQQFCGRLSSGKANAAWSDHGEIAADESGRVYATGSAASGLPLSWEPFEGGEYTGGGWMVMWSPDMAQRLACLRLSPGGNLHAVAVRSVKGRGSPTVVFAGYGQSKEGPAKAFVRDGPQEKAISSRDAIYGVIGERTGPGKLAVEPDAEPDAEGSGPATGTPSADPDEVKAQANLDAARRLLDRGDNARARELLARLIRQWPNTAAAEQARQLLGP